MTTWCACGPSWRSVTGPLPTNSMESEISDSLPVGEIGTTDNTPER